MRRLWLLVAAAALVACAQNESPLFRPDGSAGDAGTSAQDAASFDASPQAQDASVSVSDAGSIGSDASPPSSDASVSVRPLTMSEVSILFPLPRDAADRAVLLAADSGGASGALVPRTLYDRTTPLLLALGADEVHSRLRAVSARLDPCPQRLTDLVCVPEVRLVFQPISGDGPTTTTEDAALHAVYQVPDAEFATLVETVRRLGEGEPELRVRYAPLGVHPVMQREGLTGRYARGLRAALLDVVGDTRLRRLTFMQLSGRANIWNFGGFDRRPDGSYAPTRIAAVAPETQRVIHNVFTDELDLSVTPTVIDRDDFSLLYDSLLSRAATAAARETALDAALRVENPDLHDAETIDCARCHVSFVARRWHERVLGDDTSQSPHRFRTPGYDLSVPETITPPTSLRTFRAFGWLGREAAISPRTVNETAVVCRELNP